MPPRNTREPVRPRVSPATVLRLDEYRSRRLDRVALFMAFQRPFARKQALARRLDEIAALAGADRCGVVWLDEFGPGVVHAHVVLDLLSDRPRRAFPLEPLRHAWERGLPGACETSGRGPTHFAVALGSDGARAWFLVADALTGRPRLGESARERILFLAGECAAVVLHRDLDAIRLGGSASASAKRFPGWPILQDIDGREDDEAASELIERRFVVGRLVRSALEDDLVSTSAGLRDQVRRAREDLAARGGLTSEESGHCRRVLDALEADERGGLAPALVGLAEAAEARDHHHGALELYDCAYLVATALGLAGSAIDAARFRGRLHRRRARWDEAVSWYDAALEIARSAGLSDREARILTGIATIRKEMGNLPAARECLVNALPIAQRSGDADTLALVHHNLLSLEHAAGNPAAGLEHGWVAVATYESDVGRIRCLAGLAGALVDFGDRAAAEDAWTVVAARTHEAYYQIYAHDALAYLAALRGDDAEFERQAAACDALGWKSGPRSATVEILHYRGLSYRALGRRRESAEWLGRAVAFAAEHKFHRTLFKAETALQELEAPPAVGTIPSEPTAPAEVREGLRSMRRMTAAARA